MALFQTAGAVVRSVCRNQNAAAKSADYDKAVGEGGIDRDSSVVTRLLAWVARECGRSPDARYDMSRHDAAVLLEHLAGWPDG